MMEESIKKYRKVLGFRMQKYFMKFFKKVHLCRSFALHKHFNREVNWLVSPMGYIPVTALSKGLLHTCSRLVSQSWSVLLDGPCGDIFTHMLSPKGAVWPLWETLSLGKEGFIFYFRHSDTYCVPVLAFRLLGYTIELPALFHGLCTYPHSSVSDHMVVVRHFSKATRWGFGLQACNTNPVRPVNAGDSCLYLFDSVNTFCSLKLGTDWLHCSSSEPPQTKILCFCNCIEHTSMKPNNCREKKNTTGLTSHWFAWYGSEFPQYCQECLDRFIR